MLRYVQTNMGCIIVATNKVNFTDALQSVDLLLREVKSLSPQARAMFKLLADIIVIQAEQLQRAKEQIQALSDEIAVLKGNKPRPKIPKSTLEGKDAKKDGEKGDESKRPGSDKRSKTAQLIIHETVTLIPEGISKGWVFKGYSDVVVQGLVIEPHNIKYRRGRWLTPAGETVIAPLPVGISGHFNPTLISYIQHQYFACRVTQPLLLEQLCEIGIDISSGQLNEILTGNKDAFHDEKAGILAAGLRVSDFIQTDDTGARHEGKNGYCTCISNDLFAFFSSTGSKSRINFIELLRAGHSDYLINLDAFAYIQQQGLNQSVVDQLHESDVKHFIDREAWQAHLKSLCITSVRHVRVITEAALLASAISHGLPRNMVVLSDDAGQFNILIHALCWIHAERIINKLIGFNDDQRAAVAKIRDEIWGLYKKLKAYKVSPSEILREEIDGEFTKIFAQKTCFESLNQALIRIGLNKPELLRVLDYPMIPLHNNGCETDIRDPVTKRKVSGGTQSHIGRMARDTFTSLKRTCRKLGVSFWKYLNDRNAALNHIPSLGELIMAKAATR